MEIVVNIPDQYVLNYTIQEITRYIKLYTALLMFQAGQLSAGAACELAEVDRYTFFTACQQHHIAVIDYDEKEVEADLQRLTRRRHTC